MNSLNEEMALRELDSLSHHEIAFGDYEIAWIPGKGYSLYTFERTEQTHEKNINIGGVEKTLTFPIYKPILHAKAKDLQGILVQIKQKFRGEKNAL